MRGSRVQHLFMLMVLVASIGQAHAQSEPIYVQHFNNQPITNPAFTGFRNALAIDLSVRRQWLGMPGAPESQYLSAHAPINNSKLSIGAAIQNWRIGPIGHLQAGTHYSYLARLGDRMFLSLGMNVGLTHQQMDYFGMVLIDGNDPHFGSGNPSTTQATTGAGAVLFTQYYYVGISHPVVALTGRDNDTPLPSYQGAWYAMAGGSLPGWLDFTPKASLAARYNSDGYLLMDFTGRIFYKNRLGAGLSFRPAHSWSAILDVQINRNLSATYTYDRGLGRTPFTAFTSHEATISYDIFSLTKRNKYRHFKKKKEVDESQMRSIRYF
ncbi:type IX secretion system PorP/SprF family membrane protein [Breznakibacter xylanolyticus]|uniref:Type IX secretion system PorP/SprF family membrane protein n=2 Tax=Breznakibacter xylanolyticus TaxID=990 RepID=A0A2W7Q6D1_9BACT|nr:type IX secretion system PorP/SprF family membrane protein [Breznakibacter xylanolyticus]